MISSIPPEWMRWTIPSIIFIGSIITLIITLTFWDMKDPGWGRIGNVLPFETTRGDRVFMSLLITGIIFCFWLYFIGQTAVWAVLILGAFSAVAVLRLF